jgi:integrase
MKKQIEADLANNCFDTSLEKYLDNNTPKVTTGYSLVKLWREYIDFKQRTGWSPTTYSNTGLVYLKRFNDLKTSDLGKPNQIRQELLEKLSLNAAKRSLTQINAAIKWGVESKLLPPSLKDNFSGLAGSIKLPKNEEEHDINPFTAEERDLIIKAFWENTFAERSKNNSHSQYGALIEFWFYTGCRTGELLGLKWENMMRHKIVFAETRSYTNTGQVSKRGLKTQARRIFPVNNQLREIIEKIPYPRESEYVFLNRYRRPVHPKSLTDCWRRILNGLGLEYRRPYQCRHTFITLSLQSDMKVHDVSRVCGTSPEIIYRHYLGIDPDSIVIPEL